MHCPVSFGQDRIKDGGATQVCAARIVNMLLACDATRLAISGNIRVPICYTLPHPPSTRQITLSLTCSCLFRSTHLPWLTYSKPPHSKENGVNATLSRGLWIQSHHKASMSVMHGIFLASAVCFLESHLPATTDIELLCMFDSAVTMITSFSHHSRRCCSEYVTC